MAAAGMLVAIPTDRGAVHAVYHPVPDAQGAVLMVGGTDGGFDGPADRIYPTLASDLTARGIAALRVDFRLHRAPGDVEEGAYDVLAGVRFLEDAGIARVALVGHSFGGAVVVRAGARSERVVAVVTLATQSYGVEDAPRLAPRALLVVHGLNDRRLPPDCSRYLYALAREPKRLVLLEGAKHSLRQRREDLRVLLVEWLCGRLASL
ncbi:MAG TPA: alpha/beta fold hydrolase [Dehalococcoidia bacterium]|nr:alpha/beta fold hydrolase [Dehalococcoidia bacterium]